MSHGAIDRIELPEVTKDKWGGSSSIWFRHENLCVMGGQGRSYKIASVELTALDLRIEGRDALFAMLNDIMLKPMSNDARCAAIVEATMTKTVLEIGWERFLQILVQNRDATCQRAHVNGQNYARSQLYRWLTGSGINTAAAENNAWHTEKF